MMVEIPNGNLATFVKGFRNYAYDVVVQIDSFTSIDDPVWAYEIHILVYKYSELLFGFIPPVKPWFEILVKTDAQTINNSKYDTYYDQVRRYILNNYESDIRESINNMRLKNNYLFDVCHLNNVEIPPCVARPCVDGISLLMDTESGHELIPVNVILVVHYAADFWGCAPMVYLNKHGIILHVNSNMYDENEKG